MREPLGQGELDPANRRAYHLERNSERAGPDPYLNLGRQDITSHVNFEVMEQTGSQLGWKSEPLRTQRRFLLEWGLEERLMEEEAQGLLNSERTEERLGLKTLLAPGGISDTMKVLVQHVRHS